MLFLWKCFLVVFVFFGFVIVFVLFYFIYGLDLVEIEKVNIIGNVCCRLIFVDWKMFFFIYSVILMLMGVVIVCLLLVFYVKVGK